MDIRALSRSFFQETVDLRRFLHRNPELSGQESATSALVEEKLREWGIPCRRVPGNGIVGFIDGGHTGKTVALRADMDALPVDEENETSFRSAVKGVSHACGHDCHVASLLTASRILGGMRKDLAGNVRLIFQPSEEAPPGGAGDMVRYGAMENVDGIFGVHMVTNIDVGHVSVEAGTRMAASLRAYVDIKGRGGHGGVPHECVDAIVAGSAVVMNLQTIVSRELPIYDPVAITVGVFRGGDAFNAVSENVHMEATIKFFNVSLKEKLEESIARIVTNTAGTFRARSSVRVEGFCKPVANDPVLSGIAERAAKNLFGAGAVISCPPWSASEDFARYLERAPGVFAFIGGRNEKKLPAYPPHHPKFDIDEDALEVASALYAQFAVDFLSQ
mgnify:CR=1 FL=1